MKIGKWVKSSEIWEPWWTSSHDFGNALMTLVWWSIISQTETCTSLGYAWECRVTKHKPRAVIYRLFQGNMSEGSNLICQYNIASTLFLTFRYNWLGDMHVIVIRPGSIRVLVYPRRVCNSRVGIRVPGSQVQSKFTLNLNFHFSIKVALWIF